MMSSGSVFVNFTWIKRGVSLLVLALLVNVLLPLRAWADVAENDPLFDWKTADFHDQVTEMMDAVKPFSEKRAQFEGMFQRELTYQGDITHQFYLALGREIGLLLAARGYLHHFEMYQMESYGGKFPVQLRRLADENHYELDVALTSFLRAEAHLKEIMLSAQPMGERFSKEWRRFFLLRGKGKPDPYLSRYEYLHVGLQETASFALPKIERLPQWISEVRERFQNPRLCEKNLINK